MTYLSKGEPEDERIYFLARYLWNKKHELSPKGLLWSKVFSNQTGTTLEEYMVYAQTNNLKERYINDRKI
jgi:hypothetical protein